ncbi:MAG TPA: VCBS repeat-containing protein, partial [Candidatus Polarisedimenticolia bacterium]|nr:VCBS repeat-containing protein [Candidatus Polarisedimenticolia bacterium]
MWPDIVTVSTLGTQLQILRGTPGGSFGVAETHVLSTQPRDLDASDVDGDKRLDLVVTSGPGETMSLLSNQGSAGFGEERLHAAGEGAQSTVLADFDSDSRPDAAIACKGAGRVLVLGNALPAFPNLGFQLPAPAGPLQLVADGEPVPDSLVTLTVQGISPPTLGILVVGLQFAPVPFHGGTLVPSTDGVLAVLSAVQFA